ncbi:energy transducer TonB [Fulvivirga lutea]|uniref:Energy transducer TonB n=1 Tax=Fulvivirga lutea TaxID=2810512 RepID=A0A974WP39_9BACT|nr:energy transducer TonB [Fulvivirga lutea]QSE99048.1 energy transducer TonB [Fulvivirga lutea]
MKRLSLTTAILFIIYLSSKAQEVKYFENFFHKESSEITPFKRTYEKIEDGIFVNQFEFDTLKLSASIKKISSYEQTDEFLKYFNNQFAEWNYKPYFDKISANIKVINDNDYVLNSIFKNNSNKYINVLTPDSINILKNGSGVMSYTLKLKSEVEEYKTVFKDSLLFSNLILRTSKNDTIHAKVDIKATPYEGLENFYKQFVQSMNYPFLKRLAGKESKIYIQFVVDENGQLTDFEALSRNFDRFEKKTINKLSKLPNWKPAIFDGKKVKSRFVLPVTFDLTH